MKPSARVALIAALATTTPTWASLPFYSPDYTYDDGFEAVPFCGDITPNGKAANTIAHSENHDWHYFIATWRGQAPLPSPQSDSAHANPRFDGMNRYGWICGSTEDPLTFAARPALWRPDGSRIDFPMLPQSLNNLQGSSPYGYATDVNDTGFVAGCSEKFTYLRPVYWTPSGEIVELPNPVTSNQYWEGLAETISSTGIIAGKASSPTGRWHAMRWDINGTAPILSQTTNTGVTFTWMTEAFKSLDDGTILGWGSIVEHSYYGVLWTPEGDAIDLRALPGSNTQSNRYAYDVNNNHYSAGLSYNSLGQLVGTRWSPTGEPFALDRLPDAPSNAGDVVYDINDFNFVVGAGSGNGNTARAVLWTPDGDAIDFNSLIQSGDEWKPLSADKITNTGWILGRAFYYPTGPTEPYVRVFSILVPFAGTYGLGDANFDESIDFADLLIVAQNYGTETNGSFDVGDFNLDGSVDFTDLLAIAQNYGNVLGDAAGLIPNSPNPTFESDWQAARGMVPEPVAASLIMAGLVVLKRRRCGL